MSKKNQLNWNNYTHFELKQASSIMSNFFPFDFFITSLVESFLLSLLLLGVKLGDNELKEKYIPTVKYYN